MGFVLLGVFALGQVSLTGAALQMVSHGLITGLLFAMAGLTIHNVGERDLRKLGGLARQIPIIAVIFSIAAFGGLGLPLTSGFAAEFLVFVGSFSSGVVSGIQVYTILAVLGVVLAAGYILWMLQRAFYGPVLDLSGNCDRCYKAWRFAHNGLIRWIEEPLNRKGAKF
jgi:NADH-quinone oxidoreductase subunit M